MRLKRYKKKNYLTMQITFIIISIILSILIVDSFSKRINKVILPMAEGYTRKYITSVINDSAKDIKFDKQLLSISKNDNNEIVLITYDTYESTKLINMITSNIESKFYKYMNDNLVLSEIPLGIIFKNGMLKNMGPKIKVRFSIVGDILSELQTEVKPYGINNALIEIRVNIYVNAKVILPVTSKDIKINNVIPIAINIVNGSVPEGYITSYK